MTKDVFDFVSVDDLRIGLFVDLDVGWMAHPFVSSAFKVTTAQQIQQLRALGIPRIRYVPAKSDVAHEARRAGDTVVSTRPEATPRKPDDALGLQNYILAQSEKQFNQFAQDFSRVMAQVDSHPQVAMRTGQSLARGMADEMEAAGESSIRMISALGGDREMLHPVNVTVLSLLLGRALGLEGDALAELALAALLHDVGKRQLPERVRLSDNGHSATEKRMYQSHAAMGADWVRSWGADARVAETIAQHHEFADGSGFPAGLRREQLGLASQILALANRYDRLCHPLRQSAAVTPHEALSLLFAQQKALLEPRVLAAFIRMMGVYPPGSLVQLVDDRYAMVISVNSSRPLKPRVIVHEPGVPRAEALLVDLDALPHAGIRRSFRPSVLPSSVQEYLSPRGRACYLWESVVPPIDQQPLAA